MILTPTDVLTFLGTTGDGQDVASVQTHLDTATVMVKAYTRGGGFTGTEPSEDVAAVIVSCASRLYRNPTLDRSMSIGPAQTSPGIFNGWTLPELAVLHTYRRRAQ